MEGPKPHIKVLYFKVLQSSDTDGTNQRCGSADPDPWIWWTKFVKFYSWKSKHEISLL